MEQIKPTQAQTQTPNIVLATTEATAKLRKRCCSNCLARGVCKNAERELCANLLQGEQFLAQAFLERLRETEYLAELYAEHATRRLYEDYSSMLLQGLMKLLPLTAHAYRVAIQEATTCNDCYTQNFLTTFLKGWLEENGLTEVAKLYLPELFAEEGF